MLHGPLFEEHIEVFHRVDKILLVVGYSAGTYAHCANLRQEEKKITINLEQLSLFPISLSRRGDRLAAVPYTYQVCGRQERAVDLSPDLTVTKMVSQIIRVRQHLF